MKLLVVRDESSKILGHRYLNSQISFYIGLLQLAICIWAMAQHVFSILNYNKILYCDFVNGTEPVLLVGVDVIIFDIGLFHSLWGIDKCVAQHLDGGYGRFIWCICHIIAFIVCLPFAFVSRPRPYSLWPLLIQQSAYGVGLLILSLAALPRVLPTFTGDQNSASVLSVSVYATGATLNFFLLYIYWHWYWHVEAMWNSARKIRSNHIMSNRNQFSRQVTSANHSNHILHERPMQIQTHHVPHPSQCFISRTSFGTSRQKEHGRIGEAISEKFSKRPNRNDLSNDTVCPLPLKKAICDKHRNEHRARDENKPKLIQHKDISHMRDMENNNNNNKAFNYPSSQKDSMGSKRRLQKPTSLRAKYRKKNPIRGETFRPDFSRIDELNHSYWPSMKSNSHRRRFDGSNGDKKFCSVQHRSSDCNFSNGASPRHHALTPNFALCSPTMLLPH